MDKGRVITFYSYKGGTGRTMALANIAYLLAQGGFEVSGEKLPPKRVLAIDWDLEAPGLHWFFRSLNTKTRFEIPDQQPGVIELFEEIAKKTAEWTRSSDDYQKARGLIESIDFNPYFIDTAFPGLTLLKAGRFDSDYSSRTNRFNWNSLYNRARHIFPALAAHLASQFDYVLIDSRTGITDISGICTMLMPERLVVVFTPNRQSLSGVERLIKEALDYRRGSGDWRPLTIFPLSSRVEAIKEDLVKLWRYGKRRGNNQLEGYQPMFERIFSEVYKMQKCCLDQYFDEVMIQHVPDCAFGEPLPVQHEKRNVRLSLRRSYESFTERLLCLESPWQDLEIATAHRHIGNLIQQSIELEEHRKTADADLNLFKALELHREFPGLDSPDLVKAFRKRAEMQAQSGNFERAERLQRAACEVAERVFGKSDPDFAAEQAYLAQVLLDNGQLEEALTLVNETIDIESKSFGKQHRTLAKRETLRARIFQKTGHYKDQLKALESSLKIRRKDLGKGDPKTIETALQTAQAALSAEQNNRARTLLKYIAKQMDQSPEDSDTAKGLEQLGNLAQQAGITIIKKFAFNKLAKIQKNLQLEQAPLMHDEPTKQVGSSALEKPRLQDGIQVNATVVNARKLLFEETGKKPLKAVWTATHRYLTHLFDRYRYLDFRGMGMSDRVPLRLPLLEMYVPLKVRREAEQREDNTKDTVGLAGRQLSEEESLVLEKGLGSVMSIVELLKTHNGLLLLGDPGSGKTTFIKVLCLALATGQGEALGLGNRFPVLLPLSAYATALSESDIDLQSFITIYYQQQAGKELATAFDSMLVAGRVLLLFDGLDEVREAAMRIRVFRAVSEFWDRSHAGGNKLLITSRIVGFQEINRLAAEIDSPALDDVERCVLLDFDNDDVANFAKRWSHALERAVQSTEGQAMSEAEREYRELMQAMEHNPGIRKLATNPLLLTILALMKRQGVTLPERRVELYEQYVETLLKHWNLARGLERDTSSNKIQEVNETLRILAPLALWMHETEPGLGLLPEHAVRKQLLHLFEARHAADPEAEVERFLSDVQYHAGILLDRGGGRYGFIHLTFQEYLAAVAIAQKGQRGIDPIVDNLAEHIGDNSWWEVSLLTVGYLGLVQRRDEAAGAVLEALIEKAPGNPGVATVLAGESAADVWPAGIAAESRGVVINALKNTMLDDQTIPLPIRAHAGRILGGLTIDGQPADDRPGVSVRMDQTGRYIPDIDWITIAKGPFIYQENETRDLPEFAISRYPVTNVKFQAFLDDPQGYGNKKWWDRLGDKPQFSQPGRWQNSNHPRESVSWYEAVAFCRWLSECLKIEIRLPTELEWEKAARGVDGRKYPWGNSYLSGRANVRESVSSEEENYFIESTTAVGLYPTGASPEGVMDLSGNVWEWCLNNVDNPGDLSVQGDARRVLRGGSWFNFPGLAHASCRGGSAPDARDGGTGFRVCCSSPIS